MRRTTIAILAVAALLVLAPTGAQAAPDRTADPLTAKGQTYTWEGTAALATAFQNFTPEPVGPLVCSKEPTAYCETVLVPVSLLDDAEIAAGKTTESASMTVSIESPACRPVCDFDLAAYPSNANGDKLGAATTSGALDETPDAESLSMSVRSTPSNRVAYVLIEVIHFLNPNFSYSGVARI